VNLASAFFVALLAMAGLHPAMAAEDAPIALNPTEPSRSSSKASERITFGGGCFWCTEAIFQRLDGVLTVVSGYAGGQVPNPTYEAVCDGVTGHAEVIQITFDPAKVTYARLLEVFWAAHDPTAVLDKPVSRGGKIYPKGTPYQGSDIGTQYRSIILYETEAQKTAAEQSKTTAQKGFSKPIATEIVPLTKFYAAEGYHQNYYNLNKDKNPYCSYVITPKLKKLLEKGVIREPAKRR
jgi:peptide-methionine (S)-S-oxide reductase